MNDLSDSYHFKGSKKDAIALLESIGAVAAVLPETEAWTCAVVAPSTATEKIVAQWPSVLLRYEYAPEHECRITLYDDGAEQGRILLRFEGQPPKPFAPAPWIERKLLSPAQAKQ